MFFSLESLVSSVNQLLHPESADLIYAAPVSREMESLQEHLLSVSSHSQLGLTESRPELNQRSQTANELSVGPPPMYRKPAGENVVKLPKPKGSRVIFWSQVESKHQAA